MSVKDSFDAFRSAIKWSEPFIMGLITFHIVILFTTLFVTTRRCGIVPRMLLLFFVAVMVRSAEMLNRYGANNWETFATQNYFDEKGIFISIMMSAPLLMVSFIMLISYLREASGLLVQVKRQQLKEKQRNSQSKGAKTKKATKKATSKKDD